MLPSLTAQIPVPVILVSLQRVSVLLVPPLEGEVREEGMVGVRLVPRRSRTGVRLVMMELFVLAFLVALLATRSLLFF